MKRLLPAIVALSAAVTAGAAAVSGGTWGKAQEVHGLAALGPSGIFSVSCASPGNCSAGGYLSGSHGQQAMVVSQTNGTWGNAEQVPGLAALNTGGQARIDTVSCASPGNCSASGSYATPGPKAYPFHAFVVSQKNGTWGKAEEVPGTANAGQQAQITSLSCASPGNCSAGGYYVRPGTGGGAMVARAIVVSQKNGTWGKAEQVPGLAALSTGRSAVVLSVSCASPGDCSAGGYYVRPDHDEEAFVAGQKNGRWGQALPIRGMAPVDSVSCASAGNCTAGGGMFAVSEKKGTWGKAQEIPGLAALSKGGHAFVLSVSCGAAGDCSAVGYTAVHFRDQGFVVSQHNGVWGKAEKVPGLAALRTGGSDFVQSVSCGAAGNCSAGGFYDDHSHRGQGFVVSQHNGVWGKAEDVPGLAALNRDGFAEVDTVSCASAGNCSAGGDYLNHSHNSRAFVVSQTK